MDLSTDKSNELKVLVELLTIKNNENDSISPSKKKQDEDNKKVSLFNLESGNSDSSNFNSSISKTKGKNNKPFKGRRSINNIVDGRDISKLKNLINDCGMDFTTLEEVFLKVSWRNYI